MFVKLSKVIIFLLFDYKESKNITDFMAQAQKSLGEFQQKVTNATEQCVIS